MLNYHVSTGMGLNTFFTFTGVGWYGLLMARKLWGMVFICGLDFIDHHVTNVRKVIIESIRQPYALLFQRGWGFLFLFED